MDIVVIVNVSVYGCDALILISGLEDEVIHVPLPKFTIHGVETLAKSLASIVQNTGCTDRLACFHEQYMAPDDILSHILSELCLKIVCLVLNALAIKVSYFHEYIQFPS